VPIIENPAYISLEAASKDRVGATVFDRTEKLHEILRIILQVCILNHHDVATRAGESAANTRSLSTIPFVKHEIVDLSRAQQ
jgi:hypothetical protein